MEGKENILNYINQNFKDKKFLFIENDLDLDRELSILADIIVWQSTYLTEISQNLLKLIDNYPEKIFIECPINEPLFYYKNDIVPDFYVLDIYENDDDCWRLNKLSDKPLWEKNSDEV